MVKTIWANNCYHSPKPNKNSYNGNVLLSIFKCNSISVPLLSSIQQYPQSSLPYKGYWAQAAREGLLEHTQEFLMPHVEPLLSLVLAEVVLL